MLDLAAFPSTSVSCEDGLQVAVKKVFRDVPADDLLVCFKRVGKALAHSGRDLKTNMQKLPEMGIVVRR
jgi:hypothetical protein